MSPRDPVFADKFAEGRGSTASLRDTERSLENRLGAGGHVIDDAAGDKFGLTLRAHMVSENSEVRRACVRLTIDKVSVNDDGIVIAGSKAALEAAVSGDPTAASTVPIFDREWCPEEDSNLHALASAST